MPAKVHTPLTRNLTKDIIKKEHCDKQLARIDSIEYNYSLKPLAGLLAVLLFHGYSKGAIHHRNAPYFSSYLHNNLKLHSALFQTQVFPIFFRQNNPRCVVGLFSRLSMYF